MGTEHARKASVLKVSGQGVMQDQGALISGDYQTAYDQLSTASKGKITEPAFVQFWQALGGVKAWSTTSLLEQGSTATAALTLTLGNGQTRPATITLISENGVWKIENETIR